MDINQQIENLGAINGILMEKETSKNRWQYTELQDSIQETIKILKAVKNYRESKNILGL